MKYLRIFACIGLISLLYSSCVKKENYPDYPVITYNNFIPFCAGSQTDSAYLLVNFTDGNGEIGYPQQQEGVPNDFFVRPLVYIYGKKTFALLVIDTSGFPDTIQFSYRVPDITPAGTDKELNGIIQINLEKFIQLDISNLSSDTTLNRIVNLHELQFQVWMYDRSGNKSNVLITPAVYTCQ